MKDGTMNRRLSFAEIARIYDGILIAKWRDSTIPLDKKEELAACDFRRELARYERGEPIEIPPPAKWPDSGPRRWTPDEIAAARQDPKRGGEYLASLNAARCQVVREAIAARDGSDGDGKTVSAPGAET